MLKAGHFTVVRVVQTELQWPNNLWMFKRRWTTRPVCLCFGIYWVTGPSVIHNNNRTHLKHRLTVLIVRVSPNTVSLRQPTRFFRKRYRDVWSYCLHRSSLREGNVSLLTIRQDRPYSTKNMWLYRSALTQPYQVWSARRSGQRFKCAKCFEVSVLGK